MKIIRNNLKYILPFIGTSLILNIFEIYGKEHYGYIAKIIWVLVYSLFVVEVTCNFTGCIKPVSYKNVFVNIFLFYASIASVMLFVSTPFYIINFINSEFIEYVYSLDAVYVLVGITPESIGLTAIGIIIPCIVLSIVSSTIYKKKIKSFLIFKNIISGNKINLLLIFFTIFLLKYFAYELDLILSELLVNIFIYSIVMPCCCIFVLLNAEASRRFG